MTKTLTRRNAPSTPNAFTEHNWDSIGGTFGRTVTPQPANRLGWMGQHDLSVELWRTVKHWDFESAASAVEAAASHLPVLITWTNPFMDKVEVHTGYAVIDFVVMNPSSDPRLRLRYSGFDHYVYASQVRTIEQVGVSTSYEPAPVEA